MRLLQSSAQKVVFKFILSAFFVLLAAGCANAPIKTEAPAGATAAAPASVSEAAASDERDRGVAAVQDSAIPFDSFKSKLEMRSGQTYVTFMRSEVKPNFDKFSDTARNHKEAKAGHWSDLQEALIKMRAGVAIRIDPNNYIFNVGYLDGSDQENDVRSGRSYGVGPTGRQSDPSDPFYLRELEQYYTQEPQSIGAFVQALMNAIVDTDSSGWTNLSELGQTVATDFLAIYTAESDRHIMVGLHPKAHPWEIDLAAATFVSAFSAATGLIMQDGQLVNGNLTLWWAKGVRGSGIGQTRRDRIKLQKAIARHKSMAPIAKKIAAIVGEGAAGEPINDTLFALNSGGTPASYDSATAAKLIKLMGQYVTAMHKNAQDIARSIKN